MGVLRNHLVRIADWRLIVANAVMPLYATGGIRARGYYVDDKVSSKLRGWCEVASPRSGRPHHRVDQDLTSLKKLHPL
jgi:hypothetical protein